MAMSALPSTPSLLDEQTPESSDTKAATSTEAKLEDLYTQIRALNGGQAINCNSPQQVSLAVFGQKQEANKNVLWRATIDQDLEEDQRELARLILQVKDLQPPRTPNRRKDDDDSPLTDGTVPQNNNPGNVVVEQSIDRSSSSAILAINDELSSFERQVEAIFYEGSLINKFWKNPLLQLSNPSAQKLVAQLRPSLCPLGYSPSVDPKKPLEALSEEDMKKDTKKGKRLLMDYIQDQKAKYSDCIILTRVGDFYETYGVDAIILVEHCGLNPMAGKAKAGCPKLNIQRTLDDLTRAGFRVAVYEEGSDTDACTGPGAAGGGKLKRRFLAEIVGPANPTYTYNLVLTGDAAESGAATPSARPYVGILSSHAGDTMTEISMEERTVVVSERLTAEAVACRLSAYPPAEPLLYVPRASEIEGSSRVTLPFIPSGVRNFSNGSELRIQRINPSVVQQEGDGEPNVDRAKNIIVSELLRMTESKDDEAAVTRKRPTPDDFTTVLASNEKSTHPLYVETATQLGLMNDKAIPSIVSYLLPASAPVATKRFMKRHLLIPPPPKVSRAMANLVSYFRKDGGPALPPLSVPPIGKVLAMLHAGQASAEVHGELLRVMHSFTLFLDILDNEDETSSSLMTFLEYETGMRADPVSLRERCNEAIGVMEAVLCPIHHVSGSSDCDPDTRASDYGNVIPQEFFERNEAIWRGRVCREAAPGSYARVEEAARKLAEAVATDFWLLDLPKALESPEKSKVVQDFINNMIAVKEYPDKRLKDRYIRPKDRNGKELTNKYTTKNVESAVADYISACEKACGDVSAALVQLSEKIHDEGHTPAIVQASHANLILSSAINHATKANNLGWGIADVSDHLSSEESAGHFRNVWPYWMSKAGAVENTFDLTGMWLLTAPNMSGKSTIMRATAAAALLSVCGLCAPLETGSRIRRFDHIFVRGASSDIPIEQKSAFGAEMCDVAALLRCCGENSLVFVDELGRGTSPRDGTRLAGAVVESMAVKGISGVFATHLHDILHLPLKAGNRIIKKRMVIHDHDYTGNYWAYKVENGVCMDSMALVTAENFGIPYDIIERAEQLEKFLPSAMSVSLNPRINGSPPEMNGHYVHRSLSEAASLAEEIVGVRATMVCVGYTVPPSFGGKSAVYILKLATYPASFYVGETDNLRQRIDQHRAKPGEKWSNLEAVAFPVSDKSTALHFEERLIKMLGGKGFCMESTNDGNKSR